jgi:methylglutaconyl-CoA hydratase
MDDLLIEKKQQIFIISLNRVQKSNAFDDHLIKEMHSALDAGIEDVTVKLIMLRANGPHFSAGADIHWMQKIIHYSEEENKKDALVFADLLHKLYYSPKPTMAVVQGAALGGGVGLVAACDIAVASTTAFFGFPEVKLGLIPAVISPFIIEALGSRKTKYLFMTAENMDADEALYLNLVHEIAAEEDLLDRAFELAYKILKNAPEAIRETKKLIHAVNHHPINETIKINTATLIAKRRVSSEGQQGLQAFLKKTKLPWS